MLGFVFFSTLFTYTFQRFVKIEMKINIVGDRVDWMKENRILVIIIFDFVFEQFLEFLPIEEFEIHLIHLRI